MSNGARGGQRGSGAWACGWLVVVALLVAMCALAPTPAQAAGIYYVGTNTDAGGGTATTCASATNTTCTLRDAIGVATSGSDTITFTAAAFPASTPTTITLTNGTLTLNQSVTIDGTGHQVVVDGNNTSTVFTVNGLLTVAFTAFTIQHGNGSNGNGDGGGIYNLNGTLTVTNMTLANNAATFGGGIYNNGTVTVTNSTLTKNHGGGAGGGILNFGTLAVTNSTLANNSAGNNGGGIWNQNGTVTVTNSTLASNTAANFGGGIYNAGTVTVTNSTLAAKNSAGDGGGIYNARTLTVTNSTLTNNSALYNNIGGLTNTGTLTVANTILAGNNTGGDVNNNGGTITDGGHNLVGSSSNFTFNQPGDTGDPALLSSLGNYGGSTQTVALLPGSAALGGGDAAVCAAPPVSGVDQRGVARPPASCDIGAFQSQGFTFSAPGGTPQSTPITTAFPTPLTLTVSSSHNEPVVGGTVTVTAPAIGAGITASPITATITGTAGASSGTVSQSVTANGTAGGPYNVIASTAGVPTAGNLTYVLTNTQAPTITSASSTSGTAGTPFAFTVTATGAPAPTFDAIGLPTGVTLNPTSGALGGSTTVAGVYPLTLIASNGVNPDATQMFTLTVNAAAAAKLAVVQGPTNTVAGGAITPAVTVQVQDQYGNSVPTAGRSVTLAIGTNPGMGSLNGTLTQMTDASGLATFAGVSINRVGTGYTLGASSGALTSATSSAFNVTPGTATTLQVTGIPASPVLGTTASVTVTAQDGSGNTATGYTGTIHFTSSDASATLPADYTFVAGDAGVHTFTNGVVFHTAGVQAVIATDTVTPGITGSETGITVSKATPTVSVTSSATPSTLGQSVTFTATVTGVNGTTPTGSVQFSYTPMGGTSTPLGMSVPLDMMGKAVSPAIATLPVGAYTITATYSGDGNYTAGTAGMVMQTVSKATPTVGVTSSLTPSTYGQSATFTVTVTGIAGTTPTGSVQFAFTPMGGTSTPLGMSVPLDMTGKATISTSTLPAGTDSITATYSADSNYLTSSGTVMQTVTKAMPAVSVTSSSTGTPPTSTFGQSVTFTAMVSGIAGTTPTGGVQFSYTPMGGTSTPLGMSVALDVMGKAMISTSILPVGSDTITTTYSGDGNYLTSSGTVPQTVTKASTTTSVTAMPVTSTFGQSVTLTATLAVVAPGAGAPTGSVTFTLGGTALGSGTVNGSGVATLATTALPVSANQTVTATYGGNGNFTPSSGTTSVTVNPATSTTGVTANPTTSTFGSAVTLTATVTSSGGTPTGGVTFTSGGTSLGSGTLNSSGVATVSTTALPVGANQTITATYGGNGAFTPSSGTTTVTVNPVTITLTAPTGSGSGNSGTASAPSIRAGSSITLSANPRMGVTYTSSNANVAIVDPNTGAVTGISGGTAVITASGANGASGTITVTVMGGTGTGLMAPAPAPMVHTGAVMPAPGATVAPQPMSHANSSGTGGGVQPQAVGGATATPEAQPARH